LRRTHASHAVARWILERLLSTSLVGLAPPRRWRAEASQVGSFRCRWEAFGARTRTTATLIRRRRMSLLPCLAASPRAAPAAHACFACGGALDSKVSYDERADPPRAARFAEGEVRGPVTT